MSTDMSKNAPPKSRWVGEIWHDPLILGNKIIVEPGTDLTVSFYSMSDDGAMWELKTWRGGNVALITHLHVGPGQHVQMTFGSTLRPIHPALKLESDGL